MAVDDLLNVLPDDLDTSWVERALTPRHPGVRVRAVETIERHEVTNTHVKLAVDYDEPAGAPPTMFVKLPPTDPARRKLVNGTGMGPREARFYAELAGQLSLCVPTAHAALWREDGEFALVLEDLTTRGCTIPDGLDGIPVDGAAAALVELAEMHVRYEDPARRAAEAAWVPPPPPTSTSYGAAMLRTALDEHRDRLTDEFAAISEIYINENNRLQELWRHGPQTVIHGDAHIGNLFLDGDRIGFLDWGVIRLSTPLREVSYFITMALSVADRRDHEAELWHHYLDARAALGGVEIGFDDAWLAHRQQAAYTVPASCQIVVYPPGISEGRRRFSEAFLGRCEAAIADLDSYGAIKT